MDFFQYHPGVKQFGSRSGPTRDFSKIWSSRQKMQGNWPNLLFYGQIIGPIFKVAGTEGKVGGCFCRLLTKTLPRILSGLIWVQTVCKDYQQMPKSPLAGKELNTDQFLDTTFWLKPWLNLISFGFNFFHLAKVLATTNSEPG